MSLSPATPSPSSANAPSVLRDKSMKRKIEDAIQILDEAVAPSMSSMDMPPPSKKARMSSTIYSTLAKYGIRKEPKAASSADDLDHLAKTAPHLAAILSRAAARKRKAIPFKIRPAPKSTSTLVGSRPASEYRPSSVPSFLARLSTFELRTYANKPPAIDAVAAAKCGWINDGKDRLVCGTCDASWVVAGREGMSRDAANALVEKQRASLVSMHKDGCPWKTRQCDASIYRIPLQSPLAMAREIRSRAVAMDAVLKDVEIRHPLTSAQVQALLSTISSIPKPSPSSLDPEILQTESTSPPSSPTAEPEPQLEPSETSVIVSLFGWSVAPPAAASSSGRVQTSAISRANSVTPSTAMRPITRSPSVVSLREGTPIPSTSRAPLPLPSSPAASTASSSPPYLAKSNADTTLLHCALCRRRIGLWGFIEPSHTTGRVSPLHSEASGESTARPGETAAKPKRQLDVLVQHRPYCPYVVRSSVVPSLPAPQPTNTQSAATGALPRKPFAVEQGPVEGWRAVLTVVLRYGLARRQRLSRAVSTRWTGESEIAGLQPMAAEMDQVEALVAGVKSRGGKDLLKYVRGLLG